MRDKFNKSLKIWIYAKDYQLSNKYGEQTKPGNNLENKKG
jgi:hypothetical protein